MRETWLRGEDDRPDDGLDDLTWDHEPADLAAVHADDQLVSAMADPDLWLTLHSDDPGLEDRLFAMLAAWRSDIQTEPARPLVTVEQAMAALAAGKQATRQKRRFIPLAGAAAALVVAISGVAVGAKDAEPGDALWGVSKVLYTERAQSVEAAAQVKGSLAKAQSALASGHTSEAVKELAQAQTGLPAVRDQEGRDALVAQQQVLSAKAADAAPIPVVPDPTVPDPSTAQLPPMLIPPIDPVAPPKVPAIKPAEPDRSATQAAPEATTPATDPPATDPPTADTPESPPSSSDNSGGGTGGGHHNAEGSAGTGHSSDGSDAPAPSSDQPSGGDGTSSGSQPVAQADPPAPADPPQATDPADGSPATVSADTAQASGSADNQDGGLLGDLLSTLTGVVADVSPAVGTS